MRTLILSFISCCLFTSCTTTNHSAAQVEKIQMCKNQLPTTKKIKKQSITTGCLASMAFNKMINSNNPSPLLCMAGGGAGFLFGESIAERKCAYLTLQEQLDGEIAHATKLNTSFATVFAQQSKDLALLKLQSTAVATQVAADEKKLAQLNTLKQDIDQQLAQDREIIALAQDEFRFKQETLKKSRTLQQQVKEEKLLEEIRALQKSIKTLQKNSDQLVKLLAELEPPAS